MAIYSVFSSVLAHSAVKVFPVPLMSLSTIFIDFIPISPSSGLPRLRSVFLRSAGLFNLSMNIFMDLSSSLQLLDISENPWRCDCQLRNLKAFLELEKKLVSSSSSSSHSSSSSSSWRQRLLHSQSLRCSSPPNLFGLDVVSTLRLSQLTCSPPLLLREPATDRLPAFFGQSFHLRLRISAVGTPSVEWRDAAGHPLPRLSPAASAALQGTEQVVSPAEASDDGRRRSHYGTKPGHFETSKIHFPTSEGVSEVSERVSAVEGASEASSPEQANE